jgi:hypothetical protein
MTLSSKDRDEIQDMISRQMLTHIAILHPTPPKEDEQRKPPTAIETNRQFGDKIWLTNAEYEALVYKAEKYDEIDHWQKEFFEILKKNMAESIMERLERGGGEK